VNIPEAPIKAWVSSSTTTLQDSIGFLRPLFSSMLAVKYLTRIKSFAGGAEVWQMCAFRLYKSS
jgi:hypothetical protein